MKLRSLTETADGYQVGYVLNKITIGLRRILSLLVDEVFRLLREGKAVGICLELFGKQTNFDKFAHCEMHILMPTSHGSDTFTQNREKRQQTRPRHTSQREKKRDSVSLSKPNRYPRAGGDADM